MPKVTVDSAKCTGEGTCIDVCPVSVFVLEKKGGKKKSVPKNQSDCIVCRACEVQCPTQAIKVED